VRLAGSLARLVPLAAASAALASSSARADLPEAEIGTAELTAAIKARDVKAIARQLHARLDYAGVLFADPACAARFAKHAEVGPKDADAFARCLAQLRPQLSTRQSSQSDGAVLTYEPGIELELTFEGTKLAWIGFLAQDFADANLPTLSAQAFEALRRTGKTNVDAEVAPKLGALAAGAPQSAWLKLCLDATGAVTAISVREATTPKAGEVFREVARGWTFGPFVHRGKAIPVCSLSRLTYPAAQAPIVETLPTVVPATADAPARE
jgi:hypothetical protein